MSSDSKNPREPSDRDSRERPSFQARERPKNDGVESRGTFRREPPVVPERVAVLKANYKQAWLYFLLGVSLLVAWGIPIRYALTRWLAFRPVEPPSRVSTTFVSLAYEGISDNPDEVSPERFRRQIEVLKDAGYHAITLEDVRSFYREGRPLPDKAVLLTFDHSRKSSYFVARQTLQRAGWHAVMFVWTQPILDEDPAALRWPYVRAMIRSTAWEAGAQSHAGFSRIPADSEGNRQNFMSSPQWLADRDRFETPEEYKQRLEEDHRFVYDLIEKETDEAPIAFAFPYGDFGQFDERAILTRRLNMDLAAKYYDLAFIHGNAALNTAHSDPLRLNRLLVDPDWSAEDLLARLEAAWPKRLGIEGGEALDNRLAWQVDWGGFDLNPDKLRMYAPDGVTGAKAWLNGTDLYDDIHANFNLGIEEGQVGLFFRASKDGESYLYLGLGDEGEVWLRQKQTGLDPVTLGTSRYLAEPDGGIQLEVFLRGNHVYVSTGGEPLFEEIVLTRGEPGPGMVGLSVWDPRDGAASFHLDDFTIDPVNARLVTWKPVGSHRPVLAGWLARNGYRYTHLSPPWLRLAVQGRAERMGWDASLYAELAKVYNLGFTPEMVVDRIDVVDRVMAENLADRVSDMGADGLFANLSGLTGTPPLARITSWIQTLSRELRKQNLELIVTLPESLNRENTVSSLLQGLTNLRVAAPTDSDLLEGEFQLRNERVVSWRDVVLEEAEYPLYFQIGGGDAPAAAPDDEVHTRVLWERGFEAFELGEFDSAIRHWSQWSEKEPYNPKPFRLLGDAYATRKKYGLAIEAYQDSLRRNPGQISLVVRTARLLEDFADQETEAMRMLDLYRRLFPENSDILLAQAGMLLRRNKPDEAGVLIQKVVERHPDDLSALALLHKLLRGPEERVENLEQMLKIARQVGTRDHFADAVDAYDLLVWPESWRLMDLIKARAAEEEEGGPHHRLLPRRTQVREKFQAGRLSDNWINQSADREERRGELFVTTSATTTEAALILKGSETLQSGFIEAEINEVRGYFWLYARRSEGNMVRYGFDPSGQIHLQIWKDGEVETFVHREWVRTMGVVRLRLEIRGKAVYGYIDGKPAFGAPLELPDGMKLGWWGMAPWAPQFGVAQVVVREVGGGPLPLNIGLFRTKYPEWTDKEMVDNLKRNLGKLAVVSPVWYFQDLNGEIRPEVDGDFPSLRLLTRYYKIRLMPMVRSASSRTLDVEELVSLARRTNVPGFTLAFTRLPEEEWFAEAEAKLLGTGIHLLAVQIDGPDRAARVRELGSSSSLLAGAHDDREFSLVSLVDQPEPRIPDLEPAPLATPEPAGMSENGSDAEPSPESEPAEAKPSVEFTPPPDQLILF